jgi:hypothetical protein
MYKSVYIQFLVFNVFTRPYYLLLLPVSNVALPAALLLPSYSFDLRRGESLTGFSRLRSRAFDNVRSSSAQTCFVRRVAMRTHTHKHTYIANVAMGPGQASPVQLDRIILPTGWFQRPLGEGTGFDVRKQRDHAVFGTRAMHDWEALARQSGQ